MRILKVLTVGLTALLLGALALVAASSLSSLDWERAHSARTRTLPVLTADSADGLVRIEANGLSFRARVAGLANTGPPLILLHGFPETSAMWEDLIGPAAAAGFRVLALDQRGYSPGARPEGVEHYGVLELVGDVLAVADAAGFQKFHLVGHDWGCIVGWSVSIQEPGRVISWTGLSIPHPGTLVSNLKKELPAYIKVFTAPQVPETMLSFNRLARLKEIHADAPPAHLAEYLSVFSEPGALTAALNWYRAITGSLSDSDRLVQPVRVPTLFIYGTREGWVTEEALVLQRELAAGSYDELELEAGHYLMQERPDAAVKAILGHLLDHRAFGSPGE